MKTMKIWRIAFVMLAAPKKSLGVIVLLIVPCFAIGQNCMDSTTVKQDSIAISLHSIFQRDVMCNYDIIRKDSTQKGRLLLCTFLRKKFRKCLVVSGIFCTFAM